MTLLHEYHSPNVLGQVCLCSFSSQNLTDSFLCLYVNLSLKISHFPRGQSGVTNGASHHRTTDGQQMKAKNAEGEVSVQYQTNFIVPHRRVKMVTLSALTISSILYLYSLNVV